MREATPDRPRKGRLGHVLINAQVSNLGARRTLLLDQSTTGSDTTQTSRLVDGGPTAVKLGIGSFGVLQLRVTVECETAGAANAFNSRSAIHEHPAFDNHPYRWPDGTPRARGRPHPDRPDV
jgi:hypothetical protein